MPTITFDKIAQFGLRVIAETETTVTLINDSNGRVGTWLKAY